MDAKTAGRQPKMVFGWRRRLPLILQSESVECGLACLAMIASFHGRRYDLAAMRREFPVSANGTTLARLIEIADAIGLQARPLRLEPESLRHLSVPCVLHWDMNHFVVLQHVTARGRVVLHDPGRGRLDLSMDEFSQRFTGIALELQPSAVFEPRAAQPTVPLLALTGRLIGLKRAMLQIFGLALVLEVFALLTPIFVQLVTDQVLPNGDGKLLTLLGTGFLLLVVLHGVIGAIRSWSVARMGVQFNYAWTSNVFGHLLQLPESYFQRRQLGDIANRFSSIDEIQKTLTTRFIESLLDGLMAMFTLSMMLVYSPTLALISLGMFLLYAAIRAFSFARFREAHYEQIVATATQQSHFLEVVRGIQAIRLNNKAVIQKARYANKTVDALNRGIVVQRLNIFFGSLNFLVFNSQRVLILWVGAGLALSGHLTAGMLIAFLAYSEQFTTRAAGLIDYGIELRMLRLHGERLSDIVLADPERHMQAITEQEPAGSDIQMVGVNFRYDQDQPLLLQGCDFSVRQGESVAITGASGCGKTTLVKVMLGLIHPESGQVKVGGQDIRDLGMRRFRDMIGSVMQDDQLFTGSIADNISFFDEDADQTAIEVAAKAASIHDDIVGLPMGYHTLIGDMGTSLSGGQRQRVVLARALYRRPSILILDEATSHLDVDRESLVNASIRNLKITRVVIAHRPETIASSDRVFEMRDGRLYQI